MADINTEELIEDIDRICGGDTDNTKEESLAAYEEIEAHCSSAADALYEELKTAAVDAGGEG